MKLSTLNRISKKLSCQYGVIKTPEIIPLKYSRTGKSVALGYYDNENNRIEINKYAIELWKREEIQEIIQHEMIHALCYQIYGHGGHGPEFKELCQKRGLSDDIARATKRERQ